MTTNKDKFIDFKNKFCPSTPIKNGETKIQGWQFDSHVFKKTLDDVKPETIVEVGSWLGASALHMASLCDAEIICVDTFLGSNAMLWRETHTQDVIHNFSAIYDQFCINVTSHGLNDRISPLPMTSSSAAELFSDLDIYPDYVYIDAGHQYREVLQDLELWYPLSSKMIVGDDYSVRWPGVVSAVTDYASVHGLSYDVIDSKFIISK